MANCHRYSDTLKLKPHELIEELDDDGLSRVVRNHLQPTFWEKYGKKPDQMAYVRRWSHVCRREARRRGLL